MVKYPSLAKLPKLVTFPISMLILDHSGGGDGNIKSRVGCLPNNTTINVICMCMFVFAYLYLCICNTNFVSKYLYLYILVMMLI